MRRKAARPSLMLAQDIDGADDYADRDYQQCNVDQHAETACHRGNELALNRLVAGNLDPRGGAFFMPAETTACDTPGTSLASCWGIPNCAPRKNRRLFGIGRRLQIPTHREEVPVPAIMNHEV